MAEETEDLDAGGAEAMELDRTVVDEAEDEAATTPMALLQMRTRLPDSLQAQKRPF